MHDAAAFVGGAAALSVAGTPATFLNARSCLWHVGCKRALAAGRYLPSRMPSTSSPTTTTTTTMIRGFPNKMPGPSDDIPVAQPEQPKRPFDALVDFPCVFTFKVVGVREGEFLDDISDAVARVLKTERRHLKTSFRDRGKYRSITLSAPVNCAEQIYDVYAVIDLVRRKRTTQFPHAVDLPSLRPPLPSLSHHFLPPNPCLPLLPCLLWLLHPDPPSCCSICVLFSV
jgi:putative lipoic acid-binding regulatory protein